MEKLINGKFYHIYNRGNNREDLFLTDENYYYFLRLYQKYIDPIADTFAWVLMKNHFHLLVRIKKSDSDLPGFVNLEGLNRNLPSQAFSNLFNAYTKAINKRYNRTGSLFEKNFHRKEVSSDKYFRQLVIYIHTNPVHHGFTQDFKDYPWSSYGSIISLKPANPLRNEVIGWFNDKVNFIDVHNRQLDIEPIKDFIIE